MSGRNDCAELVETCQECGREFVCHNRTEHGWRIGHKVFCSYHCMRAVVKREPTPKWLERVRKELAEANDV